MAYVVSLLYKSQVYCNSCLYFLCVY